MEIVFFAFYHLCFVSLNNDIDYFIAVITAIDDVNSNVFNRNRNKICKQKWFDIFTIIFFLFCFVLVVFICSIICCCFDVVTELFKSCNCANILVFD